MADSADHIVAMVLAGFRDYRDRFAALTARAEDHFRNADWQGMHTDAAERLDVYQICLDGVVADLSRRFPDALTDRTIWHNAKNVFGTRAVDVVDADLAETFFNSVSRRMLQTDGVDPATEFVRSQAPPLPPLRPQRDIRFYAFGDASPDAVMERVLQDSRLHAMLADPGGDAVRISSALECQFDAHLSTMTLAVLTSVFYRGMGAYLIGRLITADGIAHPWAVAFIHHEGRVAADGVITDDRGIRLLFSYTHSYFFAATDNAGGLIGFLKMLLPQRRRAELFISLGFNRHGKTELYRELTQHQHACTDAFVLSPGKKGMVMAVFNMPSDNLVFKVIRDRFEKPKHTTLNEVIAKYDYVFRHDRTGRLPDAQTFEHMTFNPGCFQPEVIEELRQTAAAALTLTEDAISLARVYVERRVTPLDVYLKTASEDEAGEAVVDFGQAIKDMAASNIFPGDLLIKNFGVTELGRVIFYDYDEVCPVTTCRFRAKPRAVSYEDELAAAPWYLVGENDVFPEEFIAFLGLTEALIGVLLEHHKEIFTPQFWQAHQTRIQSGIPVHIFPYRRFDAD